MEIFRIELNLHPSQFELIPLFDIHFGTKLHNENLWNKIYNYLLQNSNAYCFIGGDICEFIPINDRRFDYNSLSPKFQKNLDKLLTYSIEYTIEQLEPIKHKILFIHAGNHDNKFLNQYGIDLIGSIAKGLNIKNYTLSLEVLTKFIFKTSNRTFSFNLYSHHGFGTSTKSGSLINKLEDISSCIDADIYCAGHSHSLIFTYRPYLQLNNSGTKLIRKNKYFLRIGGFRDNRHLNFSDYGEKFGFKTTTLGTYLIKIIKTKPNLDFQIIPIIN